MDGWAQPLLHVLVPSLFLLAATAAWALSVFSLPGNWIVLLLTLLYGWYEGFEAVRGWLLLAGALLAGSAELTELLSGYHGTRRFGGSRWTGLAALAGSLVGALAGAAFAWGLGAIPGTLAGAFLGALAAEVLRNRDPAGAVRASLGAALGRAFGLAAKLGLGGVFLALLYARVLWILLAT